MRISFLHAQSMKCGLTFQGHECWNFTIPGSTFFTRTLQEAFFLQGSAPEGRKFSRDNRCLDAPIHICIKRVRRRCGPILTLLPPSLSRADVTGSVLLRRAIEPPTEFNNQMRQLTQFQMYVDGIFESIIVVLGCFRKGPFCVTRFGSCVNGV